MTEDYLRIGDVVRIGEPLSKFYQIPAREPFDYETGEEDSTVFSAVASGADSGFKNIELLEPDNSPLHLLQVLMGFRDTGNIKYYVKIPTGQNRFGVDNDKEVGFLNAEKSPYYAPNPLFQFYLISEWYPSIKCVNNSPVTITPKVYFRGMKYDLDLLADQVAAANRPHRNIIFGGVRAT